MRTKSVLLVIVLLLVASDLQGNIRKGRGGRTWDWANHARELTYKIVKSGGDPDFEKDVDKAAENWSSAGVKWKLRKAGQGETPQILVYYVSLPCTALGRTYVNPKWVQCQGYALSQAYIKIKKKKNLWEEEEAECDSSKRHNRTTVTMHEFGHCLRLGHDRAKDEDGKKQLMGPKADKQDDHPSTYPRKRDKKEANEAYKSNCRSQSKEAPDPEYVPRGGWPAIDLRGVGDLSTATSVTVTPFCPDTLITEVVSFDSSTIYAQFYADSTAHDEEGFFIDIFFPADTARLWNYVWVTDRELPPDVYPHALAGNDTSVYDGQWLVLDGENSYHEDTTVLIVTYSWVVLRGDSLEEWGEGPLTLTRPPPTDVPREDTAILTVFDEFGQESSDTMLITVLPAFHDVALTQVTEPVAGDTIQYCRFVTPSVCVRNLGEVSEILSVDYQIFEGDSLQYVDYELIEDLAAGDSGSVEFDSLHPDPGDYTAVFYLDLDVDENPANDSAIVFFRVIPGCGDVTGDGVIGAGDVVHLLGYLFRAGPPPEPLCVGDANCNGMVESGDVVYLIGYLFRSGPPPCPDCCL